MFATGCLFIYVACSIAVEFFTMNGAMLVYSYPDVIGRLLDCVVIILGWYSHAFGP